MIRKLFVTGAACVALGAVMMNAQTKTVPRPAALPPGQQPPGESATPDGYAPIPQWLGQTRAPVPAKTETFTVETFADGLNGAGSFHFLPDGRILVGERPGRIRIVGKDGKISEPLDDMPKNMFLRGQALYEVQPDKNFATNRTIYMTYAVLPDGADATKQRAAGHLHVVSAKISADDKRLENVKDLLDAEGTSGHEIQATDGTLFDTSTVPARLRINSTEW